MVDTRDLVFSQLSVDFLARGPARVSWSMFRLFDDGGPFSFQLQYSDTGTPTADNWQNVGLPVVNTFSATDTVRRGAGKQQFPHYRVILTTGVGTYTSKPVSVSGVLAPHDWLIAREIVRQHRLRLGRLVGVQGWLLKRRWSGTVPNPKSTKTAVTDTLTGSIIRSTATSTAGTAYNGGFFAPLPFQIDMTPASHREMRDLATGTTDPMAMSVQGLLVQIPEVTSEDIFIAEWSDRRYYIEPVQNAAEWRGVPLLANVNLRVAPAGDIAYTIPVPVLYGDVVLQPGALAGCGTLPFALVVR